MARAKTNKKTTRKTTKKPSRKTNGKNTKVKRVAPDNSINVSDVAAELGYPGLAQKLSVNKPKPVLADVVKTNGGAVYRRYAMDKNAVAHDEYLRNFTDMSETNFAAWILGKDATEKIEKAEDAVAKFTKEFWQAKRRLICATQVLNAAYAKLEQKGTLVTSEELSPTEARNVVAKALEEELFPDVKK